MTQAKLNTVVGHYISSVASCFTDETVVFVNEKVSSRLRNSAWNFLEQIDYEADELSGEEAVERGIECLLATNIHGLVVA